MASDRLYEFNGQKGHWYTDEQGNRYFVAQGQTPKEGWEATKRRKMIKGGKYVKDDGDDKGEQEISADEYQTYEADEEERFDETTDADFEDPEPEGFDRDPLIDSEEPLFDESGLSTEKGIEEAKKFLDAKGVKDIDAISDKEFNALADEAAEKYGISRMLAQEFLVAPFDEEKQPKEGSYKPKKDYGIYGEVLEGDERKHMEDLAKAFNDAGLKTTISDRWQDYGAGIKWTAPLSDNTELLTPREWGDYMSGRVTVDELIEKKKKDSFWSKRFENEAKEGDSQDEKATQPDGYYKDDNGKIYMTKGGKDHYPMGEEEERDFIRAFDNQNKEKAKEMANDPETAKSFERIYADLDKGFEETYKRKPTQEEKDAIRDIARLQTALIAMATKK